MPSPLAALNHSVEQLHRLVAPLGDDDIVRDAYPAEWNIAQVLSHIGSSGVIFGRHVEEGLLGGQVPEGFNESVWDEWNAKSPREQVDEALVVDAALAARYTALTDEERDSLSFAFGPLTVDFDTAVRLRLNEHALHTWDVEVALDPAATIPDDATAEIIDGLPMIAGFAGRPSGEPTTVTVITSVPERTFQFDLNAEGATLAPLDPTKTPAEFDLELPAEAFVRLVYGRLDRDHTPPVKGDEAVLDRLRAAFPGL